MKIFNSAIIKIVILSALGAFCACQTNTAQNANQTNQPTNTTVVNTAPSATPLPSANTNRPETKNVSAASLATPTDTYKTAYVARKNKDLNGLKRVMSRDMQEFLSIMSDGKPIDDVLLQMTEKPQAATDESRNEKIAGETATLEYPDENGKWITMDFVKESGEWKITFPKGKAKVSN